MSNPYPGLTNEIMSWLGKCHAAPKRKGGEGRPPKKKHNFSQACENATFKVQDSPSVNFPLKRFDTVMNLWLSASFCEIRTFSGLIN